MLFRSAVIGLLGLLGHLSDTRQTLLGKTYDFDVLGRPHLVEAAEVGGDPPQAEEGRGAGGSP